MTKKEEGIEKGFISSIGAPLKCICGGGVFERFDESWCDFKERCTSCGITVAKWGLLDDTVIFWED